MIQVSRLTREFDGDGVFDISLSVEKGQALGLLGPAGAGWYSRAKAAQCGE